MNTQLAHVSCALMITSSACATLTPSTEVKTDDAQRLEDSVVVQLVVARMDRELPYPRVLGDLDRTIASARERLLVDRETPEDVQDWLIERSRQHVPGHKRVWKAEVSSLDELTFPEHLVQQPELDFALLVDRVEAGRIVVMVLYRSHAQLSELAQPAPGDPHRVREVRRRHPPRSLPRFSYQN